MSVEPGHDGAMATTRRGDAARSPQPDAGRIARLGRGAWTHLGILGTGGALLGLFTAAIVAWQSAFSSFLWADDGCGWDGVLYCNMASGALATTPYSRRPLVPWIVRFVVRPGTLLERFLVVDIVALVVAAAVMGALVSHLTRDVEHLWRRRSGIAVGMCILAVTPWTLRFSLSYPSNTDAGALALGLCFVLLVMRDRIWLAVLVGFAACLAREEWGVIVIVVAVVDLGCTRRRLLARASIVVAGVVGLLIDFSLPNLGGEPPMTAVIAQWLTTHFLSASGLERTLWMVITGLGLVPLLALVHSHRVAHFRDAALIGAASVTLLGVAFAGGDDSERVMLPAAMLLTALALSMVVRARSTRLDLALLVLTGGSIAVWRPWAVAPLPPTAWLTWFTPYYESSQVFDQRLTLDGSLAAGALVLAGLLLAGMRWAGVAVPEQEVGGIGEDLPVSAPPGELCAPEGDEPVLAPAASQR